MSTVLLQFKKFYKNYYSKMNIYEKRISNLIMDNFNEIEALSTGRGKRGKKIASLINENRTNILSKKIVVEKNHQINTSGFRLLRMEIEQFRGFSNPETINLSKDFTFAYGPNGTGKSCFCEALEYSLLGSIEEATIKRIPINQYIKNVFTDSVKEPIVYAKIGNKTKIVEPNPELFSFCFIEKNRIEKFARIAANSPAEQQQKVSALFGLDEWNSFVKNFNSEIKTYLPTKDEENKKFIHMKENLEKDNEFLEKVDSQKNKIIIDIKSITSKYKNTNNGEEFVKYVDGVEGKIGKIAELENQIKEKEALKPINSENKEFATLKENLHHLDTLNSKIKEEREKLICFKKEMSLKDFYQQILNSKVENKCPACLSDLYTSAGKLIVPQDPYKKASSYLKKIHTAIDLEQKLQENNDLFSKKITTTKNLLEQMSRKITPLKRKRNVLSDYSALLDKVVQKQVKFEKSSVNLLLQEISKIKEETIIYNKKVATATKEKIELEKKRDYILNDQRKVLELKAKLEVLDSQKKKGKKHLKKLKKIYRSKKNYQIRRTVIISSIKNIGKITSHFYKK